MVSAQKTEVWDFGAEQLDTAIYNNNLTVDTINKWYGSTAAGTSGVVLPNFTAGKLSWVGGTNDRLRSTNTALTRFDDNIALATAFTGRIYVNSTGNKNRYLSLTLKKGDEVTLEVKTDSGGELNFQYEDSLKQLNITPLVVDFATIKYAANFDGTYKIFDTKGKPSYFRIYVKPRTGSTSTKNEANASQVNVYANADKIYLSNVTSLTDIKVYDLSGKLFASHTTSYDNSFTAPKAGIWIIHLRAEDGIKTVKVVTQ